MKLNLFSPLPPVKTESAEYTRQILPCLSQQAEVRLWTNQAKYDQQLEKYASIHYYQLEQLPWREINQAPLNIYLLGSDLEAHKQIYTVSCQSPGLIISLASLWEIESTIGVLTHSQKEYEEMKNRNLFLIAYTLLPDQKDWAIYAKDLLNFSQKVVDFRSSVTANVILKRITNNISSWNNSIVFEEEIENLATAINFLCN